MQKHPRATTVSSRHLLASRVFQHDGLNCRTAFRNLVQTTIVISFTHAGRQGRGRGVTRSVSPNTGSKFHELLLPNKYIKLLAPGLTLHAEPAPCVSSGSSPGDLSPAWRQLGLRRPGPTSGSSHPFYLAWPLSSPWCTRKT